MLGEIQTVWLNTLCRLLVAMSIADENQFRTWLAGQNRWSHKAQHDFVSRLRRADRIVPLGVAATTEEYLGRLTSEPQWDLIPQSSRTGISASVRMYLGWRLTVR